ncbi:MAG: sigma 54-interacting transcriptional regulator, partial [Treponema sp.]|nr:sigma 54-interacting transcriptional regulator [Treponema sp.]
PLAELDCGIFDEREAPAALFGAKDRDGVLAKVSGGILLLDEIEKLSLECQKRMLSVLEKSRYMNPLTGQEERCRFQLVSTSNAGRGDSYSFRKDFISQAGLWTFRLPSIRERPEDLDANVEFSIAEYNRRHKSQCSFKTKALDAYLDFGRSAPWPGNFRSLMQSIKRMGFLAHGIVITTDIVQAEIERLTELWEPINSDDDEDEPGFASVDTSGAFDNLPVPPDRDTRTFYGVHEPDNLSPRLTEILTAIDEIDRVQLLTVINTCRSSSTMAAAARELFAHSRAKRASFNDSDRLKKYLTRFGLSWEDVR